MRNLRFYNTDAAFKAHEQAAGGDGLSVESIVPGVSLSKDLRKKYYNPHYEIVLTHTLTINYVDQYGTFLCESETKRFKYISGVTQEVVITPKSFSGYTVTTESPIIATIPDDSAVTVEYLNENILKPLTFEITSDGIIKWYARNYNSRLAIEYKKNNDEWVPITATTAGTPINVVSGDTVQFRGNNSTYATNSNYINSFSGTTCGFKLSGNIMGLVNSTGFSGTTTLTSANTFLRMFWSCTGLTDASELMLPATALTSGCYQGMFFNCTSLTTAPELPATILASNCYNTMFQGCTNLTTAPSILPATTLTDYCYQYMFSGCTSLTTAPELPAATLASYCYQGMFYGCAHLNYIKCLATNILATDCTTNWVQGVAASGTFMRDKDMASWTIGVNGIPTGWVEKVYGISLSVYSIGLYESGSTSQITVSSTDNAWTATIRDNWITLSQNTGLTGDTNITITISSTSEPRTGYVEFTDGNKTVTLSVTQNNDTILPLTFEMTSNGTISWIRTQGSPTDITIQYRLNGGNLTNLAPYHAFSVVSGDVIEFYGKAETYGTNSSYYHTFGRSTGRFNVRGNIMSLIDKDNYYLLNTFHSAYTFYGLFNNCTGLTDASNLILPATTLTNYCYSNMFFNCGNLVSAPLTLSASTLATYCYQGMFARCTSLTTTPSSIGTSATSMGASACTSMFAGCTNLTTAPELPATNLAPFCYGSMFSACTSLTTAPALSATTLADYCYYNMFRNCTLLTSAPELPATTLLQSCYQLMFYNCANLNYIKCLATNIGASNCTGSWVYGVASAGTFVKAEEMTSWTIGNNGIPTGWTVQDAV